MSKKNLTILILVLVIMAPIVTLACCPPPPPPPPPPPAADCTPGFWKQPQHFQYWVGYKPTDNYPGTTWTLLQALQGGKATRQSRFIVAGWLNAANPTAPCD